MLEETDIDILALRKKYQQERDKRIRSDGNAQYQMASGDWAGFASDPFIDKPLQRDALNDFVEIAIIGGGLGGLLLGVELKEQGFDDIRVIDESGDFGGTWYWNRFPGAMCDIESYVYLPLLEEMGYMPSEKYASGDEILSYLQSIARRYSLYNNACFQTSVTKLVWSDTDSHWLIETNRGDRIRARYVCMSNGILNRAKLPTLPGLETFTGKIFHTSRWDYRYTGGSTKTPMTELNDKRVAIIGTGATAIQCVPALARDAKHLTVIQRTPSAVFVRDNGPTDPDWVNSLESGWQKQRAYNFDATVTMIDAGIDMVADGWTEVSRRVLDIAAPLGGIENVPPEDLALLLEKLDMGAMENVRRRVDNIVDDATTASALKPWYRRSCKRPCFHDSYLPTFNRDNVTLVDTDGRGVESVTETSIMAGGQELEADCIILATGFDFIGDYPDRSGYDIIGRDGLELGEKWRNGYRTLHSMQSNGFPNCFILGNKQGTFSYNICNLLQQQATHIAYILGETRRRGYSVVEATPEAEQEWVDYILALPDNSSELIDQCTPGSYNMEGTSAENAHPQNRSMTIAVQFFSLLSDWRDSGDLRGLSLKK